MSVKCVGDEFLFQTLIFLVLDYVLNMIVLRQDFVSDAGVFDTKSCFISNTIVSKTKS